MSVATRNYLHPQQHVNELSRQMPALVAVAWLRSQVGRARSLQSPSEWQEVVHSNVYPLPPPLTPELAPAAAAPEARSLDAPPHAKAEPKATIRSTAIRVQFPIA